MSSSYSSTVYWLREIEIFAGDIAGGQVNILLTILGQLVGLSYIGLRITSWFKMNDPNHLRVRNSRRFGR